MLALSAQRPQCLCWHTLPNDHPGYCVSHSTLLLGPCWHIMPNDPLPRAKVYAGTLPNNRPTYHVSHSTWLLGPYWHIMPQQSHYPGTRSMLAHIAQRPPYILRGYWVWHIHCNAQRPFVQGQGLHWHTLPNDRYPTYIAI